MSLKQKVRASHAKGKNYFFFTFCFLLSCFIIQGSEAPPGFGALFAFFIPHPTQASVLIAKSSNCQNQDIESLTAQLLKDLPNYANRISQRARRRNRPVDIYSYVVVAGRPDFAPLTLGPGEYKPADPAALPQQLQQVFITTLERQYTGGKAVELQQYHWLFLTKTSSGWRLAMMFSRTGSYPAAEPPTPPRESSNGVIGQAVSTWLRDCQARSVRIRDK